MVTKADVLDNTKAQFYFGYDKGMWRRIKIGYWATSRPDIKLGQGVASKQWYNADLGTLSGGTRSSIIKFNTPVLNHNKSIVRAYINGFVLNSASEIFIRVFDKGLTSNAVRINVMVGKNTVAKKVHFSFLILNSFSM